MPARAAGSERSHSGHRRSGEALDVPPTITLLGVVRPARSIPLVAVSGGTVHYPRRFESALQTGAQVARGELVAEIRNDDVLFAQTPGAPAVRGGRERFRAREPQLRAGDRLERGARGLSRAGAARPGSVAGEHAPGRAAADRRSGSGSARGVAPPRAGDRGLGGHRPRRSARAARPGSRAPFRPRSARCFGPVSKHSSPPARSRSRRRGSPRSPRPSIRTARPASSLP